jgi:hypothetical protein
MMLRRIAVDLEQINLDDAYDLVIDVATNSLLPVTEIALRLSTILLLSN